MRHIHVPVSTGVQQNVRRGDNNFVRLKDPFPQFTVRPLVRFERSRNNPHGDGEMCSNDGTLVLLFSDSSATVVQAVEVRRRFLAPQKRPIHYLPV